MLTDFFDTMGTVLAVGEQAGFVDKRGRIPGIRKIFIVDSVAVATGGLFGASSVTTYVESAAGVAQGGRTDLTAIVAGILFALSAFFAPVIQMIGGGYKLLSSQHYSLFVNRFYQLYPYQDEQPQVRRSASSSLWNKFGVSDRLHPAGIMIMKTVLSHISTGEENEMEISNSR